MHDNDILFVLLMYVFYSYGYQMDETYYNTRNSPSTTDSDTFSLFTISEEAQKLEQLRTAR